MKISSLEQMTYWKTLKKHFIDQGHIVYILVRKSKSEKDLTWDDRT